MSKKLMFGVIAFAVGVFFVVTRNSSCSFSVTVVLPMEHTALSEIVRGIEDQLKGKNISLSVKNAQGDMNIMRSLIQQAVQQKTSILIPVGTAASQMALSMHGGIPVIALAAKITEDEAKKNNAYCILDELSSEEMVGYVRQLMPLKHVALLTSTAEKVHQEAIDISKALEKNSISVEMKKAQTMVDLFSIVKTFPTDLSAILILKDHLVVSGVETLASSNIPVIATDEGSVMKGAVFAIGNKEYSCGEVGGTIALQLYEKKTPAPFTKVEKVRLFINKKQAEKYNILRNLEEKGLRLGLIIEYVGESK
jgi:putative ABC transport system substrate-binding protein